MVCQIANVPTRSPGEPKSPTLRSEIAHKIPPGLNRRQRRTAENDEAGKLLYLRALPRVFTPSAALKLAGCSHVHLYRWREHDAEFGLKELEARTQVADQLEAEAIRRAYKGVRKPVFQGGLLAGHVTEYSDALLMFMLKGLRPEKYRDRADVTVTPIVKVVAGFDVGDVV